MIKRIIRSRKSKILGIGLFTYPIVFLIIFGLWYFETLPLKNAYWAILAVILITDTILAISKRYMNSVAYDLTIQEELRKKKKKFCNCQFCFKRVGAYMPEVGMCSPCYDDCKIRDDWRLRIKFIHHILFWRRKKFE